MTKVGIAHLKSHLSEHLRRVRDGAPLTVLDRDTPIAQIVPYTAGRSTLQIRPPRPGSRRPGDVTLPRPIRLSRDVVDLLLAERQRER